MAEFHERKRIFHRTTETVPIPERHGPWRARRACRLPDDAALFDGGTDATRLVEEYAAIIVDAPPGTLGIAPGSAGERTYVAALSGEDAASLRAVQRRIRDRRAGGVEGEGQLTDPDAPFFVLTRGVDLRRQIERRGAPADAIERCASG